MNKRGGRGGAGRGEGRAPACQGSTRLWAYHSLPPLNGNSSPPHTHTLTHHIPREPSSINDYFPSWQPHLCSPFSPLDHSPGPPVLGDSLQRTFEHSYTEQSYMEYLLGSEHTALNEMNKDLSSWSVHSRGERQAMNKEDGFGW